MDSEGVIYEVRAGVGDTYFLTKHIDISKQINKLKVVK